MISSMTGHGAITTHSPIHLSRARNSHVDNDRMRRKVRRTLVSMAEDILHDDGVAEACLANVIDEYPWMTINILRRKVAMAARRY